MRTERAHRPRALVPAPRACVDSRTLAALADQYLRHVRALPLQRVADAQHPPFRGLTFGSTGTAYALWRARAEHPSHLEHAERWLHHASRGASAYCTSAYPTTLAERRRSFFTGPDGALFVGALVASATGDIRTLRRRLRAWRRRALATDDRPSELLLGTAGYLAGSLALFTNTGDATMADVADALAARLVADRKTWSRLPVPGLARGRAGIVFALLSWATAMGRRVPPAARRGLDGLVDVGTNGGWLGRSWCNGAAGYTLLWSKAFEALGDERHRARAEACAKTAARAPAHGPTDVCCGLGGGAYAALAMHRLAPEGAWRARAIRLAARAARGFASPWTHGLLRGYPGLVCLALDLRDVQTRPVFPILST